MRIRKYNESTGLDNISNDRIAEILEEIKKISSFIDDKKNEVQSA